MADAPIFKVTPYEGSPWIGVFCLVGRGRRVVRHLLDRLEERLHEREELAERRALAEALLVPLDRVSLDPHHIALRVLDAARDLVPNAMLVGGEDRTGTAICVLKGSSLLGWDRIADVLDNHERSLAPTQRQSNQPPPHGRPHLKAETLGCATRARVLQRPSREEDPHAECFETLDRTLSDGALRGALSRNWPASWRQHPGNSNISCRDEAWRATSLYD